MPKFKILLTDGLGENGQSILRASSTVDDKPGIAADELIKVVGEYDALIVRGRTKVTAEILEYGKKLKVIGRAGVGVDNIDLDSARKHNVIVVNAPVSTTLAVAELTFGLLLATAREFPRADASIKKGEWLKKEFEGVELNGKTLGIIGYGRIGMEVGKRAAAFGMNVIAYDPFVSEEDIKARGGEPVTIQELYEWSDFVSLHLPLNIQTRDMIGKMALSELKDGVRIVSAARGGIIDEAALLDALNSGKVAAAALDVFATEPPGASDLVKHPRVIATPHIAAQTVEAQGRAAEDISHEVLSALQGEPLRWKVN
jgi:D-3-phosphoglycerate dehydrogenase